MTPGLWIGMITEDLEHWKSYGITTPAQLDRYFLETDVYEMHKEAYGVKGRHYNFNEMSDDDLKKNLNTLPKWQSVSERLKKNTKKSIIKL